MGLIIEFSELDALFQIDSNSLFEPNAVVGEDVAKALAYD